MKMKKRLMAFVLVFAMIAGFSEGLTPTDPALAQQDVCSNGQVRTVSETFTATSAHGEPKARVRVVQIYCYDGTWVVPVTTNVTPEVVDSKWVFDAVGLNVFLQNYGHYAITTYRVQWKKYKQDGITLKGIACATLTLTVNRDGEYRFQVSAYSPNCWQQDPV